MNTPPAVLDALLRDGFPHHVLQALDAATSPSDPAVLVVRIRAAVALGAVQTAESIDAPRDTPEQRAAYALVALATGHPSTAKARMVDVPTTDAPLWVGLAASEVARGTGDAALAVQHAGRVRTVAESLEDADRRWATRADLQLARCLADAGDPPAGRVLAERVVRELVPDDLDTLPDDALSLTFAEALDTAGALARKEHEPLAAIPMHRRARSIYERTVGPDSPLTAGCRYSLAHALHRAGDFHGALIEMQAAFLGTVRAFGPDHLDAWITRFELGRLEVDAGEMIDGFPRMAAAREEVAKRLGAQHPVVRAMDAHL